MNMLCDFLKTVAVSKICRPLTDAHFVSPSESYFGLVHHMSENKLGMVFVGDSGTAVDGIITDGDLRRTFEKNGPLNLFIRKATSIMTCRPVSCSIDDSLLEVLLMMEQDEKKIMSLLVTDSEGKAVGIVTLHDIVSWLIRCEPSAP
jgi:arabinose-5-phosphate isomerase